MRDWDAVYIDHAPRPMIAWRPDQTDALVGYVIDGDTIVRADTASGRFSNYEPAPTPQERIRRWLASLSVHAEDRTGTAAQLEVELITGRQFRARLADVQDDEPFHPEDVVLALDTEDGQRIYAQFDAIASIAVPDGLKEHDLPASALMVVP